ncbi:hypothetical protein ABZ419_04600 [Streptomyces cinnamoneus]|uniref:hypothetical protein n=1 Tax=Streptomyces cinnamoneus TaxID=53446 RepID=UPI0034112BEF
MPPGAVVRCPSARAVHLLQQYLPCQTFPPVRDSYGLPAGTPVTAAAAARPGPRG